MHMAVDIAGGERPGAEVVSLKRALLSDSDLRSTEVSEVASTGVRGGMGRLSEGLLIAFGAGGVGVTLVQALCTWLAGRRPGVRLKITRGDHTVEIDVTRARSTDEVLALYRQLDDPPRAPADSEADA